MEYYTIIKIALRKIYSNVEKCFYQSSHEKYRIQNLMYTVVTIILGRFFCSAYPLAWLRTIPSPTQSPRKQLCVNAHACTHVQCTQVQGMAGKVSSRGSGPIQPCHLVVRFSLCQHTVPQIIWFLGVFN